MINFTATGKKGIALWLIRFSLPLILSGILQQLYSWADAFIVGNVEGMLALAAVGATTAIVNFLVSLITGFTLGLGVLFAQKYGAGAREDISRILSTFVVVLGVVFMLVMVAGSAGTRTILELLDTDTDSMPFAETYLRVIFGGMPFLAVYNVYAAALRGLGNTKAPFYAVVVSSSLNVALDILLVGVMHWGVGGAAAATVFSQAVMCLYIVLYVIKNYPQLRFRLSARSVDRQVLAQGCSFGFPPMVQSSLTSFGSMLLQRFMNGFGASTVAAITTAYRVDSVVLLPIFNLGSGISTLTAQSIGAGETMAPRRILPVGVVLTAIVSVMLTVLILWAGGPLISIFGVDQQALDIGSTFFGQLAPFYVIFGAATAVRSCLEGMADLVYSSTMGILCQAFRIVCSYALVDVFHTAIFAYAEALSWILLLILYLVRVLWQVRRIRPLPA